jgi:RNA polymerase sigma-70 factor (ECF subfamily)
VSRSIEELVRREHGRVMASLSRALGDVHRAEDALQEAWLAALERWPREGIPERPGPWMLAVARNRAIDVLRREATGAQKLSQLARLEAAVAHPDDDDADDAVIADEMLGLIFACAHPSLHIESRVPLVLRAVAGLSTEEIARAFFVPPATMAQRLVRAKRKIRDAGIALTVPDRAHLQERLESVCATVYVVFTEGYAATAGRERMRADLCVEAIRLGRLLVELMPDEPEVTGLLALMLLQHSRAAARTDERGEVVTLEDQDRSRWDRAAIDEGLALLRRWRGRAEPGPYRLQAAIAAQHAGAPRAEDTDWETIAVLYERLGTIVPSDVVALNHAVAIAMARGPQEGLNRLEALSGGSLARYPWLYAARADFLRRLGRSGEAREAYRQALALVENQAEQRFLERRIAALPTS